MRRLFVGFWLVALLVGCGTNVPLSEVPVVDASAKNVGVVDTAAGAAVNSGAVVPVDLTDSTKQAQIGSLPRVLYFDYDSFVVKPEFQSLLASHAKFLKNSTAKKVVIEGHTDESGGREYNLALGQKRADAVRSALSILGVAQSQIESVSFGKEKPAVLGADEAAYAKNRRVEIRYP